MGQWPWGPVPPRHHPCTLAGATSGLSGRPVGALNVQGGGGPVEGLCFGKMRKVSGLQSGFPAGVSLTEPWGRDTPR